MTQQFHFQVLTPEKWKHVYRKTHARFIYNNQKNKICPSTGREINKLWYIHTVEHYSTIKIMDRCNYVKASQKRWVRVMHTSNAFWKSPFNRNSRTGKAHLWWRKLYSGCLQGHQSGPIANWKGTKGDILGWKDELYILIEVMWTIVQTSQTGNWLAW